MENKKLIPLSDFVLEQKKRLAKSGWQSTVENSLELIFNYTEFIKQPLKLEMFIGENRLFEGFELLAKKTRMTGDQYILMFQGVEFSFTDDVTYTIENHLIGDLVNVCYEIPLTPSALQQIGIKE